MPKIHFWKFTILKDDVGVLNFLAKPVPRNPKNIADMAKLAAFGKIFMTSITSDEIVLLSMAKLCGP